MNNVKILLFGYSSIAAMFGVLTKLFYKSQYLYNKQINGKSFVQFYPLVATYHKFRTYLVCLFYETSITTPN